MSCQNRVGPFPNQNFSPVVLIPQESSFLKILNCNWLTTISLAITLLWIQRLFAWAMSLPCNTVSRRSRNHCRGPSMILYQRDTQTVSLYSHRKSYKYFKCTSESKICEEVMIKKTENFSPYLYKQVHLYTSSVRTA